MGDNRRYLERGTILHLRRENSKHTDDWEILDKIGEGGSSVCYTAQSNKKQGRLKEFNPVDRSVDAGSMESFLAAYRTLESVKAKDVRYQVLNNYIPHYELLFSADKSGKYTGAYIWTPDDKLGTNFADYLREVRRHPEYMPEQTVANIIDIVYTLTDCVCLLHSAGILHLDLKPSNFLVTYNSRMELNTGNISLFDINTITSIEDDSMMAVGTDGFCAPEVDQGAADNRSDIYSIGAILFNALIVAEPVPDGIYRDEYYDSLDCLVSGSKLIRISPMNSSVEIRSGLTDILRKCLAHRPSDRYDYCEQLMEDLTAVRQLIDYKQPAGAETVTKAPERAQAQPAGTKSKSALVKWIGAAAAVFVLALVAAGLGRGLHIGRSEEPIAVAGNKEPDVQNATSEQEHAQALEQEHAQAMVEVEPADTASGDADESNLTSDDVFDNDEVARSLKQKLKDAFYIGGSQEFVLDPDAIGTDELTLVDGLEVFPGQKLVIPKEMSILIPDCESIVMRPESEIVLETSDSINPTIRIQEHTLLIMGNNVKVTVGDLMFTVSGGGDWAEWWDDLCLFSKQVDRETGRQRISLLIYGEVSVSCDYEEFKKQGFVYRFEGDDKMLEADSRLDRRAIFFGDSDEPFDVRLKEDPDTPRSVARRFIRGLNEMLGDSYNRGTGSEYILTPEEVGTDCLNIEPNLIIYPHQKVTVHDGMKVSCVNWNMFDIQQEGELVIESLQSIIMSKDPSGPMAAMNHKSRLTIDGVTVYAEGAEGSAAAYVDAYIDETGNRVIQLNVIGDTHVSCDYETFVSKGFKYRFEFDGGECPPKFPLDRLAIFFDGSDEPFDVLNREDFSVVY